MNARRTWFSLALSGLAVLGLGLGLYQVHQRLTVMAATAADPAHLVEMRTEMVDLRRLQDSASAHLIILQQQLEALYTASPRLAARLQQQELMLKALREDLEQLPQRQELDALSQRLARVAAPARTQPVKSKVPPRPPRPPLPLTLVQPTPPFTALGLESRGGEHFLTVAPVESRSLRQVRLLRVGEQLGIWQLHRLDAGAAVFRVAGYSDQTLPLH